MYNFEFGTGIVAKGTILIPLFKNLNSFPHKQNRPKTNQLFISQEKIFQASISQDLGNVRISYEFRCIPSYRAATLK